MDKDKVKLAIVTTATGKYKAFFKDWYMRVMRYFALDIPRNMVRIFLLTDDLSIAEGLVNVEPVLIRHGIWPAIVMEKFGHIARLDLAGFTHVYFLQVSAMSVSASSSDDLCIGDTIAVARHTWFGDNVGMVFTNVDERSAAFIPASVPYMYVMGCLQGGPVDKFQEMARTIDMWSRSDTEKGVVPTWHDESYINRYVLNMPSSDVRYISNEFLTSEEKMEHPEAKVLLVDKYKFFNVKSKVDITR